MSALMSLGLQLMGYGLAGVFTVLILFIVLIRLIVRIFPYHEASEQERAA